LMCSTYLSGVIAWLLTMALYMLGLVQDYLRSLVDNTAVGGLSFEATLRMFTRESMVTQLESTPGAHLAQSADQVVRVILRFVMYLIPDVERLDWTDYVSEGFNISGLDMIIPNVLPLVAYLVPCGLVAYYLMKSREIASA